MLKLRINPLVVKDLRAIRDYIAEDNKEYAVQLPNDVLFDSDALMEKWMNM